MTSLRSGSASDMGKVRTSNQDVALEDPDLFAVADGMGGHAGGEVAARLAVDTLRAVFQRDPAVEGLRRAFAEANRAVWRLGQAESGLRGMGTTLIATALVRADGDRQVIALANVGDSRAYVFSKDQVIQVTSDHSLAEEKVRQGQLTEAEAAVHPHRHILTRALGVASDVDVDLWELHLQEGDRILLCSDGLTNEVGSERIRAVLKQVGDPGQAASLLVKEALDHGGSDNVTVIVVDVVADEEGPAEVGEAERAPSSIRAAASGGAGAAGALDVGSSNGSAQTPSERTAPASPPLGAARSGPSGSGENGGAARGDSGENGGAARGDSGESGAAADGTGSHAGDDRQTKAHALRAVDGLRARSVAGEAAGGPPGAGDPAGSPSGVSRTGTGTLVIGSRDRARGAPGVPGAAGGPTAGAAGTPGWGAQGEGKRLHAAELRRLQPSRNEGHGPRSTAGAPRIVTFRSVLFVLLLLAVVGAAYALVRWYATDDWYVTADQGHLAVYQGRPGGFLWFKPQLVDVTPVTTAEVPAYALPAVRHDREEPSLSAAKRYVTNLHQEYVASSKLSSGSTAPTSSSSAAAPSTQTSAAAGG